MKSKRIYSLLLVAMFVSMGTTTALATTSKVSCNNTNKSIVTSVNKSNVSTWTKNTRYCVGDKVSYNGNTYECIIDHSRLLTTTTYVWKLL